MALFGEKSMEHLVKAHKWDKLEKKASHGDTALRAEIATLCGTSKDDEAYNLLIRLTSDPEKDVQLAAIKSLGEVGRESAIAHLQWLSSHIPEERTEEQKMIQQAMNKIKTRKD